MALYSKKAMIPHALGVQVDPKPETQSSEILMSTLGSAILGLYRKAVVLQKA